MSELEDGNYISGDQIILFGPISERNTCFKYFSVSFIPHPEAELNISVSKHHNTDRYYCLKNHLKMLLVIILQFLMIF